MLTNKTVLVIVVTYNGVEWLRDCLSSVPRDDERIKGMVVDNGSTDDTVKIIREEFSYIKLIESKENLGFGAANNIGFQYALNNGFDYVYLLNQDAWIAPEDILRLVEIAETNPDYGIISPLQVYRNLSCIDRNFFSQLSYSLINDFVAGNARKTLYEVRPGGMVQAAHWLVRTAAVRTVGGFSPAFYHYGEDGDYCRRARFHGYKIGIAPAIKGVHDREKRATTSKKEIYLLMQQWKKILIDPSLSAKMAYWEVVMIFIRKIPYLRGKLVFPFFKTLLASIKFMRYKTENKKQGVFLSLTEGKDLSDM